jgi:hypothetical protein
VPDRVPLARWPLLRRNRPLAWHWNRLDAGQTGIPWHAYLEAVARLPGASIWRHAQAGDLPGPRNRIDRPALRALVKANGKRRGFTFSHKPPTAANLAAIRSANANGFTVNLSADNLAHADTLADHAAGPVAVLLPARPAPTDPHARRANRGDMPQRPGPVDPMPNVRPMRHAQPARHYRIPGARRTQARRHHRSFPAPRRTQARRLTYRRRITPPRPAPSNPASD